MRPASDANGQPHWSAGIADHITIELHSAADYGTIAFTAKEVPLTIGGTVNVRVPGYLNESYYITIRHHNSLMIVSATAVSFENANINKSFSTPADVYGGKLKQMTDNRYAIFTGDVNQDNIIDLSDVSSIYNVYSIGGFSGYIPEDVSGDGEITKTDTEFIELGSSKAIKSATP